jgi:hypothetical protein
MPPLAVQFRQRVSEALALARAGDLAAAAPLGAPLRSEWHVARVELLYELAYLRIFVEWELFLEQTFLRYLCGYVSIGGHMYPSVAGGFCATLQTAETTILAGRPFALWHDPIRVITRARQFLSKCPHESVIASHTARLVDLAAVRHRIAHGQKDAKQKIDSATINLTGRRYRGARPGRFLRDWDHSGAPPRRWLSALGLELGNLAQQMV